MWQRNDGRSEEASLQNRFTAYLVTAVRRRRKDYMNQRNKWLQFECSIESAEWQYDFSSGQEEFQKLPLFMQLENDAFADALRQISERERYVFLARVLEEKSFEELATELGLGYKGVAAIYYRVIRKIKTKMKEV